MNNRVVILSDIWGKEKSIWIDAYIAGLASKFDLEYYDSCELGGVDKKNYTEKNLHHQFINGGIKEAVRKLKYLEGGKVNILAFSVGGAIAWDFGLQTGLIQNLFCLSATRLRKESQKPTGNLYLTFGADDRFKPTEKWFDSLKIKPNFLPGKGHDFYKEKSFAETFCKKLA